MEQQQQQQQQEEASDFNPYAEPMALLRTPDRALKEYLQAFVTLKELIGGPTDPQKLGTLEPMPLITAYLKKASGLPFPAVVKHTLIYVAVPPTEAAVSWQMADSDDELQLELIIELIDIVMAMGKPRPSIVGDELEHVGLWDIFSVQLRAIAAISSGQKHIDMKLSSDGEEPAEEVVAAEIPSMYQSDRLLQALLDVIRLAVDGSFRGTVFALRHRIDLPLCDLFHQRLNSVAAADSAVAMDTRMYISPEKCRRMTVLSHLISALCLANGANFPFPDNIRQPLVASLMKALKHPATSATKLHRTTSSIPGKTWRVNLLWSIASLTDAGSAFLRGRVLELNRKDLHYCDDHGLLEVMLGFYHEKSPGIDGTVVVPRRLPCEQLGEVFEYLPHDALIRLATVSRDVFETTICDNATLFATLTRQFRAAGENLLRPTIRILGSFAMSDMSRKILDAGLFEFVEDVLAWWATTGSNNAGDNNKTPLDLVREIVWTVATCTCDDGADAAAVLQRPALIRILTNIMCSAEASRNLVSEAGWIVSQILEVKPEVAPAVVSNCAQSAPHLLTSFVALGLASVGLRERQLPPLKQFVAPSENSNPSGGLAAEAEGAGGGSDESDLLATVCHWGTDTFPYTAPEQVNSVRAAIQTVMHDARLDETSDTQYTMWGQEPPRTVHAKYAAELRPLLGLLLSLLVSDAAAITAATGGTLNPLTIAVVKKALLTDIIDTFFQAHPELIPD